MENAQRKSTPLPDHQRASERARLEVAVSLESENNFYAGITNDISEGGVFVATFTPPPSGGLVELELTLPSCAAPFRVTGVVRWVRESSASVEGCPPGCGIEWRDLSPAALAAIAGFVAQRDTILFEQL